MEDLWPKFFSVHHDAFYSLHKNEGYSDVEKKNLTSSPVKRSRFYMEIDASDEMDADDFREAVAALVLKMRNNLDYVVASCDFEDYIINKTGWNWVENDHNRESEVRPGGLNPEVQHPHLR